MNELPGSFSVHLRQWWLVVFWIMPWACRADELLKVGTFDVDASPPVGSPLAYDLTRGVLIPLQCRGIVLLGKQQPVVLCAVDWIGIGNDGNRVFREALAEAAGTTPERVAVHTLHQHDAPGCDLSVTTLLDQYGVRPYRYDPAFHRDVIRRTAAAVREAVRQAQPVSHLGLGQATVEKVASNRRILGPDGKVLYTRWTATADPNIRAFPEGTIDPVLKLISLYDHDRCLVVLTYYATHPQSYYRTGLANPDFPGIARKMRQEETGVLHVHFNGAGGNIGAGKWNDGSPENRQILAERMADGMRRAWQSVRKFRIIAEEMDWGTEPVVLPAAPHLDEQELLSTLSNDRLSSDIRTAAARDLVWLRRCKNNDPIVLGCLYLKQARILHLPGELFVEYQLAAQEFRTDLFVAVAAYGDYGPGYIGTRKAYDEGGYETSPRASRVAPAVEEVLLDGIKKLLCR